MTVTARLFAGVRERVGESTIEISGTTVAEVRAALAEACPPIAELLPACRFALNDEFIDDNTPVPDGSVIDVIPPVSGG